MSADHPFIAAAAFALSLVFGWLVIRAYLNSIEDDASEHPILKVFDWLFCRWSTVKLLGLFIALAALTTTFYKAIAFLGEVSGLID